MFLLQHDVFYMLSPIKSAPHPIGVNVCPFFITPTALSALAAPASPHCWPCLCHIACFHDVGRGRRIVCWPQWSRRVELDSGRKGTTPALASKTQREIPEFICVVHISVCVAVELPNISIGKYICFCESHVFVSLPILFRCPVRQATFQATVVRKVANVVC